MLCCAKGRVGPMAHLVNHGAQHKTEAAAILTGLGHSPGDIDLILYFNKGV